MVKTKLCADCKKVEFEVKPFAKYPRKYCDKCSEKRKKLWENQWKIKFNANDED